MALSDLLEITRKQFIKKNPDADIEFRSASKEPPPTGLILNNPLLEFILDRRFLAFGRFYLMYGKKSCSKTSLFFDLAKLFQQNKGDVVWIETEHAIDLDYAKKQGLDIDRVSVLHPDSLEQGLQLAEMLIRNMPKAYPDGDTPVLIGYDSLAGSAVEAEIEASASFLDAAQPGVHAKKVTQFYREMEKPLSNEKCIFLMLNQLRQKIGAKGYGEDVSDALIGGEAQYFHSTYHWKVIKTAELTAKVSEDGESEAVRKVGSQHKIQCKRNKLGREGKGQEVEIDLWIDGGIDWFTPLVRKLGKEYPKVVERSGGYYYWKVPNISYFTDDKQKLPIDMEQSFREADLAKIIRNSPEAQEVIRGVFGIPPLPAEVEVVKVEADRKKKRKAAKLETPPVPEVKPIQLIDA